MSITAHSVKISLGEDLRRFGFEGFSFAKLEEDIKLLYNLQPATNFTVKFQDDENEWITISSDPELANAFQLCSNSILRLAISVNKEPVKEKAIQDQIVPQPLYPILESFVPQANISDGVSAPMDHMPTEIKPQISAPWSEKRRCKRKNEKQNKKWEKKAQKMEHKLRHFQERILKNDARVEGINSPSVDMQTCLDQLVSMGFEDRADNERLLRKCGHDVNEVIFKLLKQSKREERKIHKKERRENCHRIPKQCETAVCG